MELDTQEMINLSGGISAYALAGAVFGSSVGIAFAASFGLVGIPLVIAIYSCGLCGAVWGLPAGVVLAAIKGV